MIPSIQVIRSALIASDLSHCEVTKNNGGIDIGWLLPNDYAISARLYDHKDILVAIGLEYRDALEEGMVKKTVDGVYECINTVKSLATLKHDLISNLTSYPLYDRIVVEVVNLDSDYLFHSDSKLYKFTIEEFKRQDQDLNKILTEKYRVY